MIHGMLGRKVGMMRLYDGAGRARGVTVIQLGPNRVTQLRTEERDGYVAAQLGFSGDRKRLNRPSRGHLRSAGIEGETLTLLREFPVDNLDDHKVGETITVGQFQAGSFVSVQGTSKGRGFAGSVKRWGFHGGPKTHGQSDRHRAPGSVGAGTTPGKVFKGQKMAGHMGARTISVLNLLVVATDPARDLLFVDGSVPGPPNGIVQVTPGRRSPLADYEPPVIPEPDVMEEPVAADPVDQPAMDEPVDEQVAEDQPEDAQPDAGEPDTDQPDTGQPDAGEPDADQPDTGQPDADQPDADQTGADQPGAGQDE